MKIVELQPLLDKIDVLKDHSETKDIFERVSERINNASTPSMGQSVCSYVVSMTHPKAWGDMYVSNFGSEWSDWFKYLGELSDIASQCGQAIFDRENGG